MCSSSPAPRPAEDPRAGHRPRRGRTRPSRHDDTAEVDPLLEIDRLSVAYRSDQAWKTVVDDVSITVRRGEVHALIGESGSGKTQTAWSVLGLLPEGGTCVAGAIRFDGRDLLQMNARELGKLRGRRIGYVPQEPMSNLDPSYTVGHQLVKPLRVTLGLSPQEAKARVLALLARVGIADPERTFAAYPHQISGGMAQRVLIAGAVATEPDLLIADEPTTALDVTVQAEILQLLRDLQRESGMSILIVTHNFGVVADLCRPGRRSCEREASSRPARSPTSSPTRGTSTPGGCSTPSSTTPPHEERCTHDRRTTAEPTRRPRRRMPSAPRHPRPARRLPGPRLPRKADRDPARREPRRPRRRDPRPRRRVRIRQVHPRPRRPRPRARHRRNDPLRRRRHHPRSRSASVVSSPWTSKSSSRTPTPRSTRH